MNGRREEKAVGDDELNHLEKEKKKERKEAENSHEVMNSMKGIFQGNWKLGYLETSLALIDLPSQRCGGGSGESTKHFGMGEKPALVNWHFFKPITIVMGGSKLRGKPRCLCKIASGRNLFRWNMCTFKSCFSRATENSDWTV